MSPWLRSYRPYGRRAISANGQRAPTSSLQPEFSTGQVSDSRPAKATSYRMRHRRDAPHGDAEVFNNVCSSTAEILAIVTKSEAEAWRRQFGDPV
jgi:hypothetical protein